MSVSIDQICLSSGKHPHRETGTCFLEAVAWFAGEPHGDHPECVCPVLAEYGRVLNDAMPDNATRTRLLAPLIPRLVGTRSTLEVERRRAYCLADHAVRVFVPIALRAIGLDEHARNLESLPPVTDAASASAAASAAARAARAAWAALAAWADRDAWATWAAWAALAALAAWADRDAWAAWAARAAWAAARTARDAEAWTEAVAAIEAAIAIQ